MRFEHDWLRVYGDRAFRGNCPRETVEQVTFFRRLRATHPSLGAIAIHPRNEGKRRHDQTSRHKAEGMTPGASDIIIPARVPFVCELKRRDHTKARWQDGQLDYLRKCHDAGAWVCVALGADAATKALDDWLALFSD